MAFLVLNGVPEENEGGGLSPIALDQYEFQNLQARYLRLPAMASSAITLCELDDDHLLGIAAGPTHADIIVTAHDSGVFLYSAVSKVSAGEGRACYDDI